MHQASVTLGRSTLKLISGENALNTSSMQALKTVCIGERVDNFRANLQLRAVWPLLVTTAVKTLFGGVIRLIEGVALVDSLEFFWPDPVLLIGAAVDIVTIFVELIISHYEMPWMLVCRCQPI